MGEGKHFFPCISRICKMKRHPSAASSFSPGRPASTGGVPAPFWSSSEETKDRSWRRVFHRATLPRIPRSGLAAAAALFVLSQSRPASSSAPSPRLSSSASQPRRPVLRAGGEGLDAPPSPPPASRARTDTPLSRAASVSMEARLERRMQSRNASAATASLFSGGSLARCAGLQAGDAETGRTQKTQQILMWGDRKALPGGASSDIATPTEITWFADCCGENLFGECGVEPRPFDEASLRVSAHRVDFSDADPDRIWNGHGNREPQIVDVSCGLHHTICLSKDGKVYAFGDDSKIQLGLGDTRSNQQGVAGTTWMQRVKGNKVSIPRAVSYTYADRHLQHKPVAVLPPTGFPGIKQCAVTAVAAGDDFSLLLFQDAHQPFADELLKRNALFCCGETARGQCGRTLQQQQQVLSPVVFPRSASAVTSPSSFLVSSSRDLPGPSSIFCAEKIACGSKHCLALMASGKLVGWGFNAHGQVGTGGRVKGAISPPRTIAVDSEETPELPSSSEKDRETPGRLSPPLPRYLASEDGLPNFAIKNVFCNFNASAAIRAR